MEGAIVKMSSREINRKGSFLGIRYYPFLKTLPQTRIILTKEEFFFNRVYDYEFYYV